VVEDIKFCYDVVAIFNEEGIPGIKKYMKKINGYAKVLINFIHFDEMQTKQKEEDGGLS
jgi:hypothetical protein